MKTYLIAFILVLCFTCWLADAGMPPSDNAISIDKIPDSTYGVKKQESIIPDFVYSDKARNAGYITKIDDNNPQQQADYPLGLR